jgi:chromosome partitioning protein
MIATNNQKVRATKTNAPTDQQRIFKKVSLADLKARADRNAEVQKNIRNKVLAPEDRKRAPTFGTTEVSEICGLTPGTLRGLLSDGKLPGGQMVGSRREWSLSDLRHWARATRTDAFRPEGADAIVLAIANFKGGVSKTTTAVTLAQGLSMRGHKVLLVDLDPQGSATILSGIFPVEVDYEMTVAPIFDGSSDNIEGAIVDTYWPGLSLVGANPQLSGAEFHLPARQRIDPGFEFWRALDYSLDTIRNKFDVIVIDTPPSLSYTTINGLIAADGVVMPCPPSSLDYNSSVEFWSLIAEFAGALYADKLKQKEFYFFDILLTRVEEKLAATALVREWFKAANGDILLPVEILETAITQSASIEYGTIYDVKRSTVSARTYDRAKTRYDDFVKLMENKVQHCWQDQMRELGELQ